MEREMGAQLWLTSTAHRRATSLMRRRIAAALASLGEDLRNLVMIWGAAANADISDPAVWQSASPYWTEDRREFIADRYERALAGEADPEADDVDALEGFKAQYLNIWPPSGTRRMPGEEVFTAEDWAELNGYEPTGTPDVAAIENWFAQGISVALATQLPDGTVGVTVKDFETLATAGEFARASGARTVIAGRALAAKPELEGTTPVAQLTRLALVDVQRFATEGILRHDGSPELEEQALALRRIKTQDGQRIVSSGRMDALKAVAFAVDAARQPQDQPMIWV
jgi:hypothetical protein